ncbi:MAG: DUF3455 domain-containing protein [Kibdelosporangium sp.]
MRHGNVRARSGIRRMLSIVCAGALGFTVTAAATQQANADLVPRPHITPPPVPAGLQVPAGNAPFFVGHATGTQQYVCLANGTTFTWTFFGPQATLFSDNGHQETTHFLSPNPDEGGTARATWQHSFDTSTVWALAIATSTDPAFVQPGAIPWLLLDVVGDQPGPQGGDRLIKTTYIQRVNTAGGVAPSSGCATAANIGAKALVPYTTDYYFYQAS